MPKPKKIKPALDKSKVLGQNRGLWGQLTIGLAINPVWGQPRQYRALPTRLKRHKLQVANPDNKVHTPITPS